MSMALPKYCLVTVGPPHPFVGDAGARVTPSTPTAATPITPTPARRIVVLPGQRADRLRMVVPFTGLLTELQSDPPAIVSAHIREVTPCGLKTSPPGVPLVISLPAPQAAGPGRAP